MSHATHSPILPAGIDLDRFDGRVRAAGIEAADLAAPLLGAGWDAASTAAWLAEAGTVLWLARDAGGCAGCLAARAVAEELEIHSVVVAVGRRRRGLGAAMVRTAMAWGAACGATRAHLEVRVSNGPAIALYEGLGFEQAGLRRRYYRDGEDALLLSAPIG